MDQLDSRLLIFVLVIGSSWWKSHPRVQMLQRTLLKQPFNTVHFPCCGRRIDRLDERSFRQRFLQGIWGCRWLCEVSILQYANDTLFNIFTIKTILRLFELVSGLKVNFHKSHFGEIGVYRRAVVHFASILNCKTMTTPFIYLGLPIGANHKRVETWQQVIDKFSKKLSLGKHRQFPLGEGFTL